MFASNFANYMLCQHKHQATFQGDLAVSYWN